jgi:hypothetical protein
MQIIRISSVIPDAYNENLAGVNFIENGKMTNQRNTHILKIGGGYFYPK